MQKFIFLLSFFLRANHLIDYHNPAGAGVALFRLVVRSNHVQVGH